MDEDVGLDEPYLDADGVGWSSASNVCRDLISIICYAHFNTNCNKLSSYMIS